MGSFAVELVSKGVEAGLLLKAVHARRAGGLLQAMDTVILNYNSAKGGGGMTASGEGDTVIHTSSFEVHNQCWRAQSDQKIEGNW
jgi:hypothetical protein